MCCAFCAFILTSRFIPESCSCSHSKIDEPPDRCGETEANLWRTAAKPWRTGRIHFFIRVLRVVCVALFVRFVRFVRFMSVVGDGDVSGVAPTL